MTRKPKPPYKTLGVRVEEEDYNLIQDFVDREGIRVSDWLRILIAPVIEKERGRRAEAETNRSLQYQD